MKSVKTNAEILNTIRANASSEYQERVPEALGVGGNVSNVFTQYPTMKNEFLTALTNKIARTLFYSKVFDNPLKALHKGMLPYGYSLEQIFVNMAESKGFWEHWEVSGDEVKDLVGKKKPDIKLLYIERNFAYKYKTTISDQQLRTAFHDQNGLSRLVEQVVSSVYSKAYFDEFNDMKRILSAHAQAKYLGYDSSTGNITEKALSNTVLPGGKNASVMVLGEYATYEAKGKAISKAIRTMAGKMAFPTDKFNSAGVKQWSERNQLIYITTPEEQAELDVEVLANAFHMDKADVNVRVIVVDELPSVFSIESAKTTKVASYGTVLSCALSTTRDNRTCKCRGILMDSDFIQAYDTLIESRTFDNGEGLYTNYFFHKQGIMSTCYFGQIVYLVDSVPAKG
nr:MAG TPA: Head protein [Caudoviricetes sp.]